MRPVSLSKRLAALLLALVVAVFLPVLAAAEGGDIDALADYVRNGSLRDILDGGANCDWLVLAEYRRGTIADYSRYAELLRSSCADTAQPAATRQRMALTLLLLTGDTTTAGQVLAETAGRQGLMSLVFGLHLYTNGARCEGVSADVLIDDILSLALDDGGWAVRGSTAEADATAMVLQALAPYAAALDGGVIDRALDVLSRLMTADGDYVSYGNANPESGSQVIIALTALGIDPVSDTRFIKNGKSLLDGIKKYFLPEGGVSHTLGGGANKTASYQAYCALVALELYQKEGGAFYVFDAPTPDVPQNSEPEHAEDEVSKPVAQPSHTESESASEDGQTAGGSFALKWVLVGGVLIAAAVVIVVMAVKKRRLADMIIAAIVAAAVVLGLLFIKIEPPDAYTDGSVPEKSGIVGTVTFTVSCPVLEKQLIPTQELPLGEGETVYDLLVYAARRAGVAVAANESVGSVYVVSIRGISEFDYGSKSGWIYLVNGVTPSVDAGSYMLSDGDTVEWKYVDG